VFSRTTPPFVFKDDSGITVDIFKEALRRRGHTVKPIFVNIARGVEMFKEGIVDANSLVQEDMGMDAFYSKDFIEYKNIVISRKNSNIEINSIKDI